MPQPTAREMIPADEVRGIIANEVQARVAEIISAAKAGASDANEAEPAWIGSLAMAIAQLTDQGTGRSRRVPPEVMVQRELAQRRMLELLVQAKQDGLRPRYRLVNKVYLDDVLIDPKWIDAGHRQRDTEIEWQGVPSEAMRPLNETAERIFAAFSEWIGGVKSDEPRIHVTAKGLSIVSGPERMRHDLADREAQHVGGGHAPSFRVVGRDRGEAPITTAILGTIAQPAVQVP
jgi:hypothetical protein